MSKLLTDIHEYLQSIGFDANAIKTFDTETVNISEEIAIFAHRNQFRSNGKKYMHHPYDLLELYRDAVGIIENNPFCIDVGIMNQVGVPYDGVQEVCLMHDVLEDTEVTIDEIEETFTELGFGEYFLRFVKTPLLLITHKESDSYEEYLDKVMTNPVSAMVKLLDLTDNMNLLGLSKFEKKEKDRVFKYVNYFEKVNERWHFLENVKLYNELYAIKSK